MDYRFVLKTIWGKSKLSFFLSLFSVTVLFLNGFVIRPFRLVPLKVKARLHAKASAPYTPGEEQLADLEFAARQAIYIFAMHDVNALREAFPGYSDYHVGEARHVRYTLITDNQNKRYHVAIRGSENEYNWIDNFTPEFVYDGEIDATIHMGYRDIALEILHELQPKLQNKTYSVSVSGGSLGGVSSVAVGWYLDTRGYSIEKIYNLAGPKLTDDDYSHLKVLSVFNRLDPVWMLPLATLLHRYRHQGERLVILPSPNYKEDKGAAEWRVYKDTLLTDFLLSSWGVDIKLDAGEHLTYGSYILRFIGKEE